jgi:hypothetical protein
LRNFSIYTLRSSTLRVSKRKEHTKIAGRHG